MIFVRLAPQPESAKPVRWSSSARAELGLHIAEQLRAHHETVIVVDPDEAVWRARASAGWTRLWRRAELPNSPAAPFLKKRRPSSAPLMDTELNYRVVSVGALDLREIDPRYRPNQRSQTSLRTLSSWACGPCTRRWIARPCSFCSRATLRCMDYWTRTDDDEEVSEVEVCNGALAGKTLRQLAFAGRCARPGAQAGGELWCTRQYADQPGRSPDLGWPG